MALTYGNRVKVNAASAPAFGDFILGSAQAGYQSFASAGIANGNTVRYVIEDGSNWEIGTGTYSSTGPKVARTTVIQSSAGGTTLINASANAVIMLTVAAADFLSTDGGTVTGTLVLPATTSIGPVSSTELGYIDGVTSAIQTQLNAKAPTASPTLTGTIALSGTVSLGSSLTETVYAITGTTPVLNPANGTVQTWTLSNNSTPSDGFSAGQAVTFMIDDGTNYTISWPSVTWKTGGGVAPTLNTTGYTAIVLWKVGTVLYGARVGNA